MRWWLWFFWGLAARLSAGCRHALSPAVRQQIDTTLSFTQLRTTPAAYKDRIVMLGGDILSTRNLTQGTLFEVLQKPLDATDRPLDMDRTEGRFMALCEGYLDPEVYAVWSTAWLAHMRPNCRAAWTGVQLKLEGGVREDYRSTSISPVAPATAAELDGARNQLRSNLDPG